MFGWPLVVLALFTVMPARRAVIAAFLFAWLFLPVAAYEIPGLPNYTKTSATSYAVVLGVLLFDSARLTRFRPSWIDLPLVIWCVTPLATSVLNGLGAYDGVTSVAGEIVAWGIPWFIGRLYFGDLDGLRELAIGVFVGGLIYVPLCLYEIRMSPQLHDMVYGYHQHSFGQTKRFGGWRPVVFMQHGLAVGFWMTSASLAGVWLWRSGVLRHVRGVSMSVLVPALLVTTILCKSTGALAELLMGLGALTSSAVLKLRWPVVCLALAPAAYCAARSTGMWTAMSLVSAAEMIDEDRAASLRFRLENESILAEKARQKIAFGWGRWGRNRVYDDRGNDLSVTDGLWIIVFGQNGLFGLVTLGALLLTPPLMVFWKIGNGANLAKPEFAAPAVLAVVVVLYAIDCLFNAMVNPVYMLCAGALVGVPQGWETRRSPRVSVQSTRLSTVS